MPVANIVANFNVYYQRNKDREKFNELYAFEQKRKLVTLNNMQYVHGLKIEIILDIYVRLEEHHQKIAKCKMELMQKSAVSFNKDCIILNEF
jgi:hypothetical protein